MDFKKEDFIKMKSFEGITFLGLRHTYFDNETVEEAIDETIEESIEEIIEEAAKEEEVVIEEEKPVEPIKSDKEDIKKMLEAITKKLAED